MLFRSNDTATTEIYTRPNTLSLHDALPIYDDDFLLRVEGDSMIDAGIHNDDLIVVHRQATADNGDIVVALVGDEATTKRFFREAGRIRLQPANDLYEPIVLDDVELVGRVVGVLRRL